MTYEYIARIQLSGRPSEETYERLHALVAKEGGTRTGPVNGGRKSLPHGTYFVQTTLLPVALAEKLRNVASLVGHTPEVVVSGPAGMAECGLKPVQTDVPSLLAFKMAMRPQVSTPPPPAPTLKPPVFVPTYSGLFPPRPYPGK
jgi:hypothetical protein